MLINIKIAVTGADQKTVTKIEKAIETFINDLALSEIEKKRTSYTTGTKYHCNITASDGLIVAQYSPYRERDYAIRLPNPSPCKKPKDK